MFWTVFIMVSCIKTLYIPSYKSTDFEVHRNWLAITSSLPYTKWYTENTSEWTLDYPPYFAWFEFLLSRIAFYFDPNMLKVDNLNYSSWLTILFQRLSVIVTDLVFALGVKSCADHLSPILGRTAEKHILSRPHTLILLLLSNTGLFLVDHIHFQYNGFLSGILLLSIGALAQDNFMLASVWFSVLLNLKHIYLYIAPAYGIYLLRSYCFLSSKDGRILWNTFSLFRLVSLAIAVVANVAIAFGPFIHAGQLAQVISRLFPFKRGLCHAYWAPNFWAVYNMADKVLVVAGKYLGLLDPPSGVASMTGGLVQDISHTVLPNISPLATAVITLLSMLPALVKLWLSPHSVTHFLRCLVLCAWSSFLFGWHVHEKAVLLIILPLALLALVSKQEAKYYILTSIPGHFSLFPLLYGAVELPSKLFFHLSHSLLATNILTTTSFCWWEKLYLSLSIPVFLWSEVLHSTTGLDSRLPFLPLLLYSLYAAGGIISTYLRFYRNFLLS
eukprot:GFUD01032184.1.p1 GENE.GFUD01032184.1~~GFUD01032184.1.p1  ORF type:complete len:500 (-),score=127.36 GFUD01032184.1:48-1547(-)